LNFKFSLLSYTLLLVLPLCNDALSANDSEYTAERQWQQDYAFNSEQLTGSKLRVDIIIGSIEVVAHAGSTIEMSIDTHLRGITQQDLELAEQELEMIVEETSYGLLVFLETPYRDWGEDYRQRSRDYRFQHDITIGVPNHFDLDLKSVTGGDIRVESSHGSLRVKTVTGDVILSEASGSGVAETISGDMQIYFGDAPDVDIELASRFGKLFSDFDYSEIPGSDELLIEKVGDLTSYRKNPFSRIRIGEGGENLKLKSLSGDIAIQKLSPQ